MKILVELDGRDRIEVSETSVRFRGCTELTDLMKTMRKSFGPDLKQWPLPQGSSHSEILLRETVLKLRGEWNYPYREAEVCHCRNVSCKTVDEAVVSGAHTTTTVSRQTTASTACGTCRPDVQKIIDYRIHGGLGAVPEKKSA